MTFSQKKISVLGKQKEKGLFTFLIAAMVAAAVLLPYIISGNGILSLFGDFNSKLIPYYKYCHAAVKNGNIYWSFETGLGAGFIGYYAFYLLGNPFFLITLPFKTGIVPFLIGPVVILEFACAAWAAYLYIRRFTRTPYAACIGGLIYAFSGFSVCGLLSGFYGEAIVLFPLILLAMELFITENCRGGFAVTVALLAASCRFFAGVALFLALYFFARVLSGAVRITVWHFINLIFEFAVGFLMAAAIFMPFALNIAENIGITGELPGAGAVAYDSGVTYLNIIKSFFFPPEASGGSLFAGTVAAQSGWVPLFGIAGAVAFFKSRQKSWLKAVITVCALILIIPFLNSAFYNITAGWLYMPILLLCLMTATAFEDTDIALNGGLVRSAAVTAVFALAIGLIPREVNGETVIGLFENSQSRDGVLRFITTCVIAVSCIIATALLIFVRNRNLKAFFRSAVAAVMIVSVLYSYIYISDFRASENAGQPYAAAENSISLPETGDYRIDIYGGIGGEGVYSGYAAIAPGDEISPASVKDFYALLDIGDTLPDTGYAALRSLLSVKYLLNDKSADSFRDQNGTEKMPGYSYLKTAGGYHIYENDNYIGYGFSYGYYMTYDYLKSFSGRMRAELMLKAILLNDEQVEKYRYIMDDIKNADFDYIYGDNLSDDAAALAATSATKFKTDEHGFSATVTRDEKSLVFFSIPYAEGWSATVNGKTADTEPVNGGFMAVAVDEGVSVIRFDYITPGLDTGIYISLVSLIVFLIYFLAVSIYAFKHKVDVNYPEGKQLLSRWANAASAQNKNRDDLLFEPSLLDKLEEIPEGPGDFGGFNVNKNIFDK